MARKDDLEKVQSDIQALVKEAQEVQTAYTAYATKVGESIIQILKDAGVYDRVHKLEVERQEEGQKVSGQHGKLQEKIRDLEKVRDYLANLEKVEAPALEVVPPMQEETPAPVPEV